MPEKVTAYKAKDGSVHTSLADAVEHELKIDLALVARNSYGDTKDVTKHGNLIPWLLKNQRELREAFDSAFMKLVGPEGGDGA